MNRIFKTMLVAVAAICIIGCQQYDDFNKEVNFQNLEGIYYVQEGSYEMSGYYNNLYRPITPAKERYEVKFLEGKLIVNDVYGEGSSEFVIPFEELKQVSSSLTHLTEPLEYEWRTEYEGYDILIRFYYNNSDKAHKKIYVKWESEGYISEFYGKTNALPFEPKPAYLRNGNHGFGDFSTSKEYYVGENFLMPLYSCVMNHYPVADSPKALVFRANQKYSENIEIIHDLSDGFIFMPEKEYFIPTLEDYLLEDISIDNNIGIWLSFSDDLSTIYLNTNGTEFIAPQDASLMFANMATPNNISIWNIDFGKCFNTTGTTRMEGMFAYGNYKSLDLSCFNTIHVWNMADMFAGCEYLKSVNLSSFNTSGVYDFSGMFAYCKSLEELDLSLFYIYDNPLTNVIEDQVLGMFTCCHNLKSLILGEDCIFAKLNYDEDGKLLDWTLADPSVLQKAFYEVGASVNNVNIYYKSPFTKQILSIISDDLNNNKYKWIPLL